MILSKGNKAPGFDLFGTPDEKLNLANLKGKRVILTFYPADWSPVCSDQLALYNEILELFSEHNAEVIGISVDSKWCHKAFAENRNLSFPLLSDFEPKSEIEHNSHYKCRSGKSLLIDRRMKKNARKQGMDKPGKGGSKKNVRAPKVKGFSNALMKKGRK